MDNILSKRAEVVRDWEDFLIKHLNECISDPYDEKKNPTGYVNLGTAVNNMCRDIILPRLTSKDVWSCDVNFLQYRECYGIMRLRKALAKVFTELLETHEEISPENLVCVTGVTSSMDLLAHCLADPGEVFLSPSPMYGRICTNLKQRALVDIWPIPVITEDDIEDEPQLTMEKIIKAYEKAIAEKHVVRGLLLINPSNPLGDIYSPQLLMDILSFCYAHSLHAIVDEVYALSVFSTSTKKFHSILKFCNLPDPERTHVLHGLSKDFGIAGFRIGTIHTVCEPLKKSLYQLCFFQCISFPIMDIAAKYLEDIEWCKRYVSINQERLAEKFNFCADYFKKKIGLRVRNSSAGFFLWVDFRNVCGSSFEQEMDFFEYVLNKARLYIGPGKKFFCAQPGWFRIVFTESPHHVNEGLSRLEKAIKGYKPLNT